MIEKIVQRPRFGFTLTELLVVIGLVTVLISLLLPAVGKAKAAANSSACLSNLRQLGTGWTMYLAENRGRLPDYVWSTPATSEVAWLESWPGIVSYYKISGAALLCPSANVEMPFNQTNNRGFGNVSYAWTGKWMQQGSGARFNISTYRAGSYGYNRYLAAGNGFGQDGKANRITAVHPLGEVPVFLDSVTVDFAPPNGSEAIPVQPPPNLHWDDYPLSLSANEHWRFLIARHGRSVNGYMADGSAHRVALEEAYELTWKSGWNKYRLSLPLY